MSAYWQKLRDPRWQRRRLEIMCQADFACEVCGATDQTLNVHHKIYRKGREPWAYEDYELACVCENCHETEHAARDELQALLAQMDGSEIDYVVGYAKWVIAHKGWESASPEAEVLLVRNAEQADGLAAGIGLLSGQDPEYDELCKSTVRVSEVLNLEVLARDRRRHRA